MAWFAGDFRAAFWVAVIPAALCVLLIVLGVEEPADHQDAKAAPRITLADVRRLGRRFAIVTGIAVLLTLARFSEAFLVLGAQDVGMALASVPWVMVAMTAVYALVAFPAGVLADRGHSPRLIACGLAALVASDVLLAQAAGELGVLAGAGLWGLHLALTQGISSCNTAQISRCSNIHKNYADIGQCSLSCSPVYDVDEIVIDSQVVQTIHYYRDIVEE